MTSRPVSFFDRPTKTVARALLGDVLVHALPTGPRLMGRIVETEAYTEDDPASHAAHLQKDPETGVIAGRGRGRDLFAPPGTAYVYLIYGRHWLLNVVTEPEGTAGAVLIRAVEPVAGRSAMRTRRDRSRDVDLTNGPGKLTEAFGIDDTQHGTSLTDAPLYLAEGAAVDAAQVAQSSRIGISNGVERPWRWYVAGNPYVSRATPSDQR